MNTRPLAVTVLAWLYIAVGSAGLVRHFPDLGAGRAASSEWIWIEPTELLAVIAGIFLLRGRNWARWLAVAWMAFHVAISFGAAGQLIIHGAFCAVIVWLLFRDEAARYFRASATAR